MSKFERECAARWPWLLRALWNPVIGFDLLDNKGHADHGKIIPWAFLVFACVMAAVGRNLSWYELLALGSLSFGSGAWRTFLKSRVVSGTFTDAHVRTETITKSTIRTERDVAAGIDPAP